MYCVQQGTLALAGGTAEDHTTGPQADGTACEHPTGDLSPGAYASSCEDDDDDFQDPVTAETISDPVLCRSGAVMVMRTLLI